MRTMISGWIDLDQLAPAAFAATPDRTFGNVSLPGHGLRVEGRASTHAVGGCLIAVAGAPRFATSSLSQVARERGDAAAWAELYAQRGTDAPAGVMGPYSVVIVDGARRQVLLAGDRFAIQNLYYLREGSSFAFGNRIDAARLAATPEIDNQAIYDYLYFHVIPAPRTIVRGVCRVPAAHTVLFDANGVTSRPHWRPDFVERRHGSLEDLKTEFRTLVRNAVRREASSGIVGAFLSGGTDSSTIAGYLGEVTGGAAKTYSIGFDAQGYDEMEYARIAARRFGTAHHEYYVTPDDIVARIPQVAAHYDQPFGNSSVVPAFCCASMARADGVEKLLAGDGGDELFGGNSRYARQRVLALYATIPGVLRRGVIEPMLLGAPGIDRLRLLGKAASYVRQARVPMPDRMNTYNLLMRLGVENVLTPDFLAAVDPGEPEAHQRATYASSKAESLVNRMLAFDWVYTLADNDLPKVCGATELAQLDVGFPLLADDLVDFSLRLDPRLKLKGLKLRWFFKEALRGFLPEEILTKTKHGFGLPFGVWAIRHKPLRELAADSIANVAATGIVRREFVDSLLDRKLSEHPGYYGEMVWILMMLGQWLSSRGRESLDSDRFRRAR
jgi:asparagine synthase (glutamine-hydrolysing)